MIRWHNNEVEWVKSLNLQDYPSSLSVMDDIVRAKITLKSQNKKINPFIWLLEYPAIYTAGVSANSNDIFNQKNYPVYNTGRGGQYTYHGRGQRVVYVILDLKTIINIHNYIFSLEEWIIKTLGKVGISATRRDKRIGIWVINSVTGEESKIAAIGVKVSRGITFHGVAININPNLEDFQGIVPCGIKDYGVCSLKSLGVNISMFDFDKLLEETFYEVFKFEYDYKKIED